MPKLKQLECSMRWQGPDIYVPEYSTVYSDGQVETYIAVPEPSTAFRLRLKSHGYIAPGLAMFIYVDGDFQCSRQKCGLKMPNETTEKRDIEVDFEVYQNEIISANGSLQGKPWRVAGALLDHNDEQLLGRIEVVILRCYNNAVTSYLPPSPLDRGPSRKNENSLLNWIRSLRWFRGTDDSTGELKELPLQELPYGLDGAWDEEEPHNIPESSQKWGYRMTGSDTGEYIPLSQADSMLHRADSTPSLSGSQSSVDKSLSNPTVPPVFGQLNSTDNKTAYRSLSRKHRIARSQAGKRDSSCLGSQATEEGWARSKPACSTNSEKTSGDGGRREENGAPSKYMPNWSGADQLQGHSKNDDFRWGGEEEPVGSSSTVKQSSVIGNDYTRKTLERTANGSKPALIWDSPEESDTTEQQREDLPWASNNRHFGGEDASSIRSRSTSPLRQKSWSISSRRWSIPGGWPRGGTPSPPINKDGGWAREACKSVENLSVQSVNLLSQGSDGEKIYKSKSVTDLPFDYGRQARPNFGTRYLPKLERNILYSNEPDLQVVGIKKSGTESVPTFSSLSHKEDRRKPKLKREARQSGTEPSFFSHPGVDGDRFHIIPQRSALLRYSAHQCTPQPPKQYFDVAGMRQYLDTHDEPYAVFTFFYQTKAALERLLDIEIADPLDPDELERRRLLSLSKEELVEHVLKAKAAIKVADSATASWVHSSSQTQSSQRFSRPGSRIEANLHDITRSGVPRNEPQSIRHNKSQRTDEIDNSKQWQHVLRDSAGSPSKPSEKSFGTRRRGKSGVSRKSAEKNKYDSFQKTAISGRADGFEGNSKVVRGRRDTETSTWVGSSQANDNGAGKARWGGGDVSRSQTAENQGTGAYQIPEILSWGGSSNRGWNGDDGENLHDAKQKQDFGLQRSKLLTSGAASQKSGSTFARMSETEKLDSVWRKNTSPILDESVRDQPSKNSNSITSVIGGPTSEQAKDTIKSVPTWGGATHPLVERSAKDSRLDLEDARSGLSSADNFKRDVGAKASIWTTPRKESRTSMKDCNSDANKKQVWGGDSSDDETALPLNPAGSQNWGGDSD